MQMVLSGCRGSLDDICLLFQRKNYWSQKDWQCKRKQIILLADEKIIITDYIVLWTLLLFAEKRKQWLLRALCIGKNYFRRKRILLVTALYVGRFNFGSKRKDYYTMHWIIRNVLFRAKMRNCYSLHSTFDARSCQWHKKELKLTVFYVGLSCC